MLLRTGQDNICSEPQQLRPLLAEPPPLLSHMRGGGCPGRPLCPHRAHRWEDPALDPLCAPGTDRALDPKPSDREERKAPAEVQPCWGRGEAPGAGAP